MNVSIGMDKDRTALNILVHFLFVLILQTSGFTMILLYFFDYTLCSRACSLYEHEF